jgi:hypothetical protein
MTFTLLVALLSAAGSSCSVQLLDQVTSHGLPDQGIAWEAISEACEHALPQRLVQGLRRSPASPASQGAQIVADLVREDPARWSVLCPGGPSLFASSLWQHDAKGRRYDVCGWEHLALGSREEFQRANAPELAVLAFHLLVHDAGLDLARARLFARAIGGLSAPSTSGARAIEPTVKIDRPEERSSPVSGALRGGTSGFLRGAVPSKSPAPRRQVGLGGLGTRLDAGT